MNHSKKNNGMGTLLSVSIVTGFLLLLLYPVYRLLLAGENQHAYNRAVLLSVYAVSLLLGILITSNLSGTHAGQAASGSDIGTADLVDMALLNSGAVSAADAAAGVTVPWIRAILCLWIAGMVIFTLLTIAGHIRIFRIVRRCERQPLDGGYTLAVTERQDIAPFSIRRTIVMSRSDFEDPHQAILTHELRHLQCHHWIDLLIGRLFIIFNWFNPAVWLMNEELRTVHEYQADMAVLRSGADARQYQLLLIKKAVGKSFTAIANSLNHSNLKKRITMMLKTKSNSGRRFKALALVPAAAAALLVTAIPAVASTLTSISEADIAVATDGQMTEPAKIAQISEADIATATDSQMTESAKITQNPEANQDVADKIVLKEDTLTIRGIQAIEADKGDSKASVTFSGGTTQLATVLNGKPFTGNLNEISSEDILSIEIRRDDPEYPNGAVFITTKESGNDTPVVQAEQMPQFPGGERAMLTTVMQNLKYPDVDLTKYPVRIRVIVKFEICKDGSIGDKAQILHGDYPEFNEAAIEAIKALPKFEPGKVNGEPVAVWYTIPITFSTMSSDTSEKAK